MRYTIPAAENLWQIPIPLFANGISTGVLSRESKKEKIVLASTKKLEGLSYDEFVQKNPEVAEQIEKAIKIKSSLQFESGLVNYYEDESGNENIIYLSCNKNLSQNDVQLIEMFSFNLSSAIELYYR